MTLTVSDISVEPDPLSAATSGENLATAPLEDSGFGPQPTDEESLVTSDSLLSSANLASASTGTTFMATASASGPNGDYSKTPMAASDSWDVGIGSGALTYS